MKLSPSRIAAILALFSLAQIPAAAEPPYHSAPQQIEVRAQAIEAFDPREVSRKRFGALEFRGGLVLESKASEFGGISGFRVSPDGQHFVSVTDRGYWLRGRIVYRGSTPIAITDAEIAPMLGADGQALNRRGWYDAESLAEDGGTFYVGLERVQQIVRFDYGKDGLLARGHPIAVPGAVKSLASNQSLECLAMPPKGSSHAGTLLAVAERGADSKGNRLAFMIGAKDGAFSLVRRGDMGVSDCVIAPDDKLLILERGFSWTAGISMRIRSIPLADIKPGATVDGPELIFADMAYQIDNMEGLAVHRASDGTVVLTMISDDNFSPLQRTVLLQFALIGE